VALRAHERFNMSSQRERGHLDVGLKPQVALGEAVVPGPLLGVEEFEVTQPWFVWRLLGAGVQEGWSGVFHGSRSSGCPAQRTRR
jgi:hypothetical protein